MKLLKGKATKEAIQQNGIASSDREVLMKVFQQAKDGNFQKIDVEAMQDKELATLYNEQMETFWSKNNEYTMNLNHAMSMVGNNTLVNEMLKSVETQTGALDDMKETSHELNRSIANISSVMQNITGYINNAVNVSKVSVESMNQSMGIVTQSHDEINKINTMVQTFKVNTGKISDVIDIVKSVAGQTNLLSLNASIEAARAGEAGKGFAVVANEVKNLSESTRKATEDISNYISQLLKDIDELVLTINHTSDQINEGNKGVQQSISDVQEIYESIKTVDTDIQKINEQVMEQDKATNRFNDMLGEVAEESDTLKSCCNGVGEHIFKVSRSMDLVRGRIARFSSNLDKAQWLEIYETDHVIYTWRLFNHIYGYEKLELKNVSNSEGCKLGKWIHSITDTKITEHPKFRQLKETHMKLHKKGVECYEAVEHGQTELAIQYYEQAQSILEQLVDAIHELKRTI